MKTKRHMNPSGRPAARARGCIALIVGRASAAVRRAGPLTRLAVAVIGVPGDSFGKPRSLGPRDVGIVAAAVIWADALVLLDAPLQRRGAVFIHTVGIGRDVVPVAVTDRNLLPRHLGPTGQSLHR